MRLNNTLLSSILSVPLLFSGPFNSDAKVLKNNRMTVKEEKTRMPSLDGYKITNKEEIFCKRIKENVVTKSYVSKRGSQIAMSAKREGGKKPYLIVLKGIGFVDNGLESGYPEDGISDKIMGYVHFIDYCAMAPRVNEKT